MARSPLRPPRIERLPNLLEELHRGDLLLPRFQRDFMWSGQQRLDLCDSVLKGIPCGSLMVWTTTLEIPGREQSLGPYPAPAPGSATPRSYLLDGGQRLRTLYAALARAFWTRDEREPPARPDAKAPDGTAWAIDFELDAGGAFSFHGVGDDVQLGLPGLRARRLPLAVVFDDAAYDEWRAKAPLSREALTRTRALRSAFHDYSIPVVTIASDDVGFVTTTFKRVNEGGLGADPSSLVRALAWSVSFDPRDALDQLRTALGERGWPGVPDETLLKIIAVVADLSPTEIDTEELARRLKQAEDGSGPGRETILRDAAKFAGEAVGMLSERLGIRGLGTLPYEILLVLVARTYWWAAKHGEAMDEARTRALAGWVAAVSVDGRFTSLATHMVDVYWRQLCARLGLPAAPPPRPERTRDTVEECVQFGMQWAHSRVLALVLAQAQAPEGERALDTAAGGTDSFHRIFTPGEPLLRGRARGQRGRIDDLLASPANRFLAPPQEAREVWGKLLRPDTPEDLHRRHLIPRDLLPVRDAAEAERFLDARRRLLVEAENRWLERMGASVTVVLASAKG